MKPTATVGDIVDFIGVDGVTYAAIVTQVYAPDHFPGSRVDLTVFPGGLSPSYPLLAILQQREPAMLGAWRPRPESRR